MLKGIFSKNFYLFLIPFLLGNFFISAKAQSSSLTTIGQSSDYISSNPAAVNIVAGTGAMQQYVENILGIKDDHGIRIGGEWVGDTNDLFSGGIPDPQRWTSNSSLLLSLTADTEKLFGLEGGLFEASFLQFNGDDTNREAGSVQGYNSLPGHPPLDRSQLYQLWYRQKLFNNKLIFRIGKSAPTYNFGNVSKPLPLDEDKLNIPAVSGLIFTPLFVNTTMLGVMPGYYNSAYGATMTVAPNKTWYLSLGAFDGSLAQGIQTGLTGPNFNGDYFYIGETGLAWLLGNYEKPGYIGVGLWNQTGLIGEAPDPTENGASGLYIYGTQRLWYKNPGVNNQGISAFYQYGVNNSSVLPMKQYIGSGFTTFGLVPKRPNDSAGIGMALSWLNQAEFDRNTELMLQAYYQAQILKSIYAEPVISYIPTPGVSSELNPSWAATLRLIALF